MCDIINGFTPLRSNHEFWNNPSVPWFTVNDIHTQGRRIYKTEQSINECALSKDSNRLLPAKTILLCCTASVGEYAITEIPLTTNQQFNGLVIKEHFRHYYLSEFLFKIAYTFKDRLIKIAGKTTFNFISVKKVSDMLIPFPPLTEQKRIVEKIEELLPYIEKYEKAETQLTALNASFPEALKKSILQEAVQGKLVPQNPDDEPASVLLERIRAEKQALIKAGKIKKDKHESVIITRDKIPYEILDGKERCIADEVPFEIPEGWEWCRLKNICTKLVDGDHNPPKSELSTTEYLMLSSTNINNNTLVELDKVRYLSKETFEKEDLRTKIEIGDVFFTSVGSLGRSCIYKGGYNICFQRSVTVLKTLIYNHYLKYYFDNPSFQSKIIHEATGTAQKGFYLNQLSECLIAIPPISEQNHIVEKINELMPIINSISK